MRLTPTERDRLLLFSAAELARARRSRGLLLNVPEATAVIADAAAEAARDGARLLEAVAAARSVLSVSDVLPGVYDIVTEVKVEAVFDDGTRLIVIRDPFGKTDQQVNDAPGRIQVASTDPYLIGATAVIAVLNTSEVPVSITSHFHFFEVNARLQFDRKSTYGMHLAVPAGSSVRFDPGVTIDAPLAPIGGERVAIGFAGLVDGHLDDPHVRERSFMRAAAQGYLGMDI
jgi:urease subunit gamma/beta